MSGNAAPLVPSTSSSANSIASATARTESAGLQRQVKPMPTMLRRAPLVVAGKTSRASGSPAMLGAPDHPQAGPVVVDGGHLDVDQPDRQRVLPDNGVGDVAAVASGPAWPGDPQRAGRIDPPGEFGDLLADIVRVGEEGEDDVGAPVGIRVGEPGWRVGQIPPVRRIMQVDPLPGLEAELGRLRATRVPRRRHRRPATDGFTVAGTSIPRTGLMNIMDRSMACSRTPRHSAGSPSMTSRRPRSSMDRPWGSTPRNTTGC